MKALLYKEFRLVCSPVLFSLIALFTLFPLIPSYPDTASFFYILAIYPMIFLGANKGTNNNDVYFSLTLPVSRKDIVKARTLMLMIIQVALIILVIITSFIGTYIESFIPKQGTNEVEVGLSSNGILPLISFTLLSFSVLDIIFLPFFYIDARSFSRAYITAFITFVIVLSVLTMILPSLNGGFEKVFNHFDPLIHSLTLAAGILLYIVLHYLTYILASKNFKRVSF